MASPLVERLSTIRVLFRAPDSLSLYGIPYDMRPGQSPRDLWMRSDSNPHGGPRKDWIYLGNPGWWGRLGEADIRAIESFLEQHRASVPNGPYEWAPIGLGRRENPARSMHRGQHKVCDLCARVRASKGARAKGRVRSLRDAYVALADDRRHGDDALAQAAQDVWLELYGRPLPSSSIVPDKTSFRKGTAKEIETFERRVRARAKRLEEAE